ncbi:membrane-spanning 4-domains subfamily A member 4A-like isoform X1 [Narcine bancroftii]|uniref:membrane-spanning 4-domains subfamily A member 4A-like isoform X1 n=1 Tax=Narcine bancroftii TaxID=1343680 RepID=UPI003831968F
MDTASPGPSIQLQRAPKPFQKLHRGQPKALGVVLLMLAAVEFLFGFPVHYGAKSFLTGLGTPWWVAVLFVVSGCLAIVCEEAPNKPRVTACLAVNIVNAVGTSTGIINCCFDLAFWTANIVPESSEYNNHLTLVYGLKGVLLAAMVSGLVLNLVLSIFCCRGLRYCSPNSSMPVVMVSAPLSETPHCTSSME